MDSFLQSLDKAYGPVNADAGAQSVSIGKAAKPAGAGFSWGNLGSSAAGLAGAGVKFVKDAAMGGIPEAQNVISGTGSASQQAELINKQSQSLDELRGQYTKAYQQGRIDATRYKALITDLGKQYSEIAGQSKQLSNAVGTYGSRAKAGAQIGATVATLAAPELKALQAAGQVGKVGEATNLAAIRAGVSGADLAKGVSTTEAALTAAKTLAAKTISGTIGAGEGTLPGKLARNALVSQPTVDQAAQFGQDVGSKQYGKAAKDAALAVGPSILLGAGAKYLPGVASAAKIALFGENAGPIAKFFGSDAVKKASPEAQKILRQAEGFTLNQPGIDGDLTKAGSFLDDYLKNRFKLPDKVTPEEFAADFKKFAKGTEKLQALKLPGNPVLSADYRKAVPSALKLIDKAGEEAFNSAKSRQQLAEHIVANLNTNPRVQNEVRNAITESGNTTIAKHFVEELVDKSIVHPDALNGFKAPKGFIVTYGPKDIAHLPSLADSPELTLGKDPGKILGKVGDVLHQSGVSPVPESPSVLRGKLNSNFSQALSGKNVSEQASVILSKLNSADKVGAFDPRLLTKREIGSILGVSKAEASTIRKALDSAYNKIDLGTRGLGNKLTDAAISKIPGERQYLRAQNVGRFSGLNPFFQAKVAVKGGLLAQAESGGNGFGKVAPEINDYVNKVSGGKRPVEGLIADYTGGSTNVKPGIVGKWQQNQAGNMVQAILNKQGATLDNASPELQKQLKHAVESVFGYPKGGYLDSNLAKTLNLALFPSRFDTKVLDVGVKFLAKQPPIARAALVTQLINGTQWLESKEGQDWQHKNSELIGVLNYFTPTHTLESVAKAISGGGVHLQDFGSLGGLPFGIISTILQNQGVDFGSLGSSTYAPKGTPVPKKIPADAHALLAQGLNDLIGSMFSYPGKSLGLAVGKGDVAKNLDPTGFLKGGQYNSVLPDGTEPTPPPAPARKLNPVRNVVPALPTRRALSVPGKKSSGRFRGVRPSGQL